MHWIFSCSKQLQTGENHGLLNLSQVWSWGHRGCSTIHLYKTVQTKLLSIILHDISFQHQCFWIAIVGVVYLTTTVFNTWLPSKGLNSNWGNQKSDIGRKRMANIKLTIKKCNWDTVNCVFFSAETSNLPNIRQN